MPYKNVFTLRRPCANCPFRRDGAIELEPGRLDGIIDGLVKDDWSTFNCHKTVHNDKTGGEWDEDGKYTPSGEESMCAGAIVYLEKIGRPTVGMRLGHLIGDYDPTRMEEAFEEVIDPPGDDG
ncbi:hypothetical protein [Burkholderia cenocepacia]|uniref:hypothetical protein n=1 Tax=Burkholderia cenocepacia TaxID=95486 RepID=UPI000761B325|nr:hypothetical protein [Burkholderia cenocepacia]KWU26364.1 hypothetical protein AS149_25585 [Burkholderia cenocepacia]